MLTPSAQQARMLSMLAISIPVVIEDIRNRRIPNWSCAALFVCGLAIGVWDAGLAGFGSALAGAAVAFALFLAFHVAGGMGGGDVKLMGACGAIAGLHGVLTATMMTAIAGALAALLSLGVAALRHRRVESIAYAPAIVIGTAVALLGRAG